MNLLKIAFGILGLTGVQSQDPVGSNGCTAASCVFANPSLRFGTGVETSVNAWGLFVQPWYYSHTANTWYKLTYYNYPLDTAIGTGTTGPNWSGATVTDIYSLTASNSVTDYSNFVVDSSDTTKSTGHGKIVATRVFTVLGQTLTMTNIFSLGYNDSFVKIVTRVINNSTGPISNMIVWTGTRDDFVGLTDSNTKTRGNLINGSFVAVTANNQASHAIMITNTNEGVLFYSETPGVMTAYSSCCSFSNVYNTNPLALAPATPNPTDGSYAAVLPLGNIQVGETGSITWFYAAGAVSSLSAVAENVAAAQVADAPSPTQSPLESPSPSMTPTQSVSGSPSPSMTPTGPMTGTPSPSMTSTGPMTDTPSPSMTPTSASLVSYAMTPIPIPDYIITVQLGTTVVPAMILINVVTVIIAAVLLLLGSRCCNPAVKPVAVKRNLFRPLAIREPETTVTIVDEQDLPNQVK